MIQELVPAISTTQISKNLRGDKVLIDPSQNDYADTLAAAYSVRPNKIPSVSTPLEWKEVNKKLDPANFTIETIGKRIKAKGDLFSEVLNKTIAKKNAIILKKLN